MSELDHELKMLGLRRAPGGGKRIGNDRWLHRNYAHLLVAPALLDSLYRTAVRELGRDFQYDVIRAENCYRGEGPTERHPRTDTSQVPTRIAFFECPDFATSNEPMVGACVTLHTRYPGVRTTPQSRTNPLIYHHKWMMVEDECDLFDVEASKRRSLAWKRVLGVDKSLSGKIGRQRFWDEWLDRNGLDGRRS